MIRSDLQGLQIRDTLLSELPALLDEVVLDSACFRCREGLCPIDGAFAHRNLRAPPSTSTSPRPRALWRRWRDRSVHVNVLEMNRAEPAWVLQEVVGRDQAGRDRRHLELELDQRRIE